MNTVEAIEQAVKCLHPDELAKFRHWFADFEAAAWDQQIEADAVVGKLDALAAEAMAEYRDGKSREI